MTDNPIDRHVKILFEVQRDDGSIDIEGLWAVPTARGYRIDNIPFYVCGVACDDEVLAAPAADGALQFIKVIRSSGHSTIRLWLADESEVKRTRDDLRQMGCSSELDLSRLIAVDVPPSVPYTLVREYLDELEATGVLEYEEACIGHH